MPLNIYMPYSQQSEKDLYEDLIIESIQAFGQDVYYLPRNVVQLDRILNEDIVSKFDKSYVCEMYLESIDGFEGDGKLITKFGLEIRDQITLVVSVKRWKELVGRLHNNQVRPQEGDLIYFPLSNGLFSIKFVEDKKPFFQMGSTPTYKLICELFEYANQDIDTGIDVIDEIQSYSSQGFAVIVSLNTPEQFEIGERVSVELPTGVTGSCEILKQENTSTLGERKLYIGPLSWDDNVFHPIVPGTEIVSSINGATGEINFVFRVDSDDDIINVNDSGAQNASFQEEGDVFIDWSASNPFN